MHFRDHRPIPLWKVAINQTLHIINLIRKMKLFSEQLLQAGVHLITNKNVLLRMKLTAFVLLIACLQAGAKGNAQSITYSGENVSLKKVFSEIRKQSGYAIFYNYRILEDAGKVTINVREATIEETLDKALSGKGLGYTIEEKTIVISKKSRLNVQHIGATPDVILPLEDISLIGRVTNEKREPMEGVSVMVKGTQTGTTTNADGQFQLSVPSANNVELVFSFVGYTTKTIKAGNQIVFNVVLEEAVSDLSDVVVIGYGTAKKSDLTGSIVRISMDEKASLPNMNVFQALSGAAAGVHVQGVGGAGSEPELSIRGQTSLSASDAPLIVIDGIIYNGAITDININDIEAIDVLKDASAAAVYGSRSANGVMLITTKKGKSEEPSISFNSYFGFQGMTNNPMKVMNADQYAIRLVDYFYEQDLYNWYRSKPTSNVGKPVRPDISDPSIVANSLRTQEEKDNYLAGKSIDWIERVTRPAPIQNYNLSLSGKSKRINYYVSGSYSNEKGILENDNFKRFTFHTNIESKINDWLSLGFISSYSYRDYSGLAASLTDARLASPLANDRIGMSNYDMYLTGETYMLYPFNNLSVNNIDIRNSLFAVGKTKVTLPWIKGLTYELNYSNTYSIRNNNTFYPVNTPQGSVNKGLAIKAPSETGDWVINNIIAYTNNWGSHQINATALYSRESSHASSSTLRAEGFDNPVLGYNNMSLGTLPTVASEATESNDISYMARLNYSFRNRYLLTATIRKDGFSGFGSNKKFASFPSLSLGWVVSKESFMDSDNNIFLKLRVSYGRNGNQGIGSYSSFSRMSTGAYVFGSSTAIAIFPTTLGNSDLGWESTSSLNFGADFGFLNKRISGSIDLYNVKTTGVLVTRGLPSITGYPSVFTNIGGINNKGFELGLETINVDNRSFKWSTNLVFSLNRDKITKLYGGKDDRDIGNSWFVGEPISAVYDYKMVGNVWTEEELYTGNILDGWYPGQLKYVDLNKDGIIDPDNDRAIIGYKTPNYRFSIENIFTYKNFSFSFLLNSIQGGNGYYLADNGWVLNPATPRSGYESSSIIRNNVTAVRPYWTPENGVNNAVGIYYAPIVWSGIYQSRSFIRLQDVSLAYRLNPNLIKTSRIKGCQFYLAGKNVYTITKWSGWDPETETSDLPLMRNLVVGIKLTL